MSGCVCENIHHLCMREELIFFMGIWSHVERKNNDEHFLLACRKGSYNNLPRKSIGALIGGGGALKKMKILLAEILDLSLFLVLKEIT